MDRINIAGIDPSLTHTGIAKGVYDLKRKVFDVTRLRLVVTENETCKTVRKNSDDLRRVTMITEALYEELADCQVVFSEVPTGTQSARAAFAFGMVLGILGGVFTAPGFKPRLIQVLPREVKLAIPGGSKVTSKEEIVDWAVGRWPTVGWLKGRAKSKFKVAGMNLTADNEHLADACAAINAGVRTSQFRDLTSLLDRVLS